MTNKNKIPCLCARVQDPTPAPDKWVIERCDDGSTTRIDWITGGGDAEGEFARLGLVREWEDGRVEYRTYSAHGSWSAEPRLMQPTPDAQAIREAVPTYRDGWRFAYRQFQHTGSVPDPDYVPPNSEEAALIGKEGA